MACLAILAVIRVVAIRCQGRASALALGRLLAQ